MTNLAKREDGNGFSWIINLDALEENQREIEGSPIGTDHRFEGTTLFIVGGCSGYFSESDISLVDRSFPNAIVKTIEGSGHNPHFEFREEFISLVANFAESIELG